METKRLKRREPVNWFSREMEKRLRRQDYSRGCVGWRGSAMRWLYGRLGQESFELADALANQSTETALRTEAIIRECADVANFAMMIADNARQEAEGHD